MMDIVDKGISGRDKSLEKDGRVYEDSSGGRKEVTPINSGCSPYKW